MQFAEVSTHEAVISGNQAGPALNCLLEEGLLEAIDRLIVLRCGTPPYLLTLGVPHQAGRGAERICERRLDPQGVPCPREADENAALYALAAFESLARREAPCKLVIMAHATTHDPNKVLESPYCREVFADPTGLIFECHGSKRERRLDLELSAGRNRLPDTPAFGRALSAVLGRPYRLGVQKTAGKSGALIFEAGELVGEGKLELPACRTDSLIEAARRGIPALHLEAKPRFRRALAGSGWLSTDGLRLGEGIAASALSYLQR